MRPLALAASIIVLLTLACSDSGPTAPANPANSRLSMFATGTIVVHVHWGEQGIAGKQVEVLGTGLVKTTDQNGYAYFRVSAGDHTVRAYGINRGGPAFPYVDTEVMVIAYQKTLVDVLDCLYCV